MRTVFLVGKPEGRRPFGRPRHRLVSGKYSGKLCSGFIWIRIGTIGGLF